MGTMAITPPAETVQNVAPASGATVQMDNDARNGLLLLNPAGLLAALSVNVPDDASSRIGQERRVYAGKGVTLLTVAGGTILNAPVSLALGDGFTLVKVAANTWAKF